RGPDAARHPQPRQGGYLQGRHGGGQDPPPEILDFAGTPREGEACLPLRGLARRPRPPPPGPLECGANEPLPRPPAPTPAGGLPAAAAPRGARAPPAP